MIMILLFRAERGVGVDEEKARYQQLSRLGVVELTVYDFTVVRYVTAFPME